MVCSKHSSYYLANAKQPYDEVLQDRCPVILPSVHFVVLALRQIVVGSPNFVTQITSHYKQARWQNRAAILLSQRLLWSVFRDLNGGCNAGKGAS